MDNYAYQHDENNGRPFAITRYPSRTGQNDYLVEINSRGKIFKKPTFYKILSALLFLLALILLIGLIVLIVLYLKPKPTLCTTDECLRAATNLKYSLDLSVDPCDNFYEYTCGHWAEEHPNHGWFSTFSSFTTITERVAISSLNALTSDPSGEEEPEALQKGRDFYKSCMDVDAMDNLGLTVTYKYLQRAKLPVVPSLLTKSDEEKKNYKFDWMKSETLIKQIFSMDVFIGFAVEANIFNGSENVIYLGLPYQKCPLPGPIRIHRLLQLKSKNAEKGTSDNEINYDNLEKIVMTNIIRYVLNEVLVNTTTVEPTSDSLQEAIDVILNMTDVIEQLSTNFTDPDEDEESIFPISFSNLQTHTNNFLGTQHPNFWINYFNFLFTGTNVTTDPDRDLLYTTESEIQYLLNVLRYVMGTSDIYVELYMWWVTIYAMIINTSSDIVEHITKQFSYYGSGASTIARSRSLECALLVNNYMGYAVSYALADETFPNKTKPKVQKMINDIKHAFVQHVYGIDWMDKDTKKVTLEKSTEMLSFIGYPDWLFKKGELDEYYKDVKINPNTYLDNMLSTILSHSLKQFVALRKKHERDWYSEPIEVNAFNSFSDNAINVPMAILNFPMYNLGLEVLNYGSIGAILGHELTHGFDNMGRKHDKYGNHVQWWTNQTIETFEKLTECFVKQYNNFTIEELDMRLYIVYLEGVVEGLVRCHITTEICGQQHISSVESNTSYVILINGRHTLGENLADNGGLNQAFTAYKRYVRSVGEEPKLPGFENFTSTQMFFIAYGSIWCETTTLQDLKDQIEYDEHCPNSIRVVGTLQNSKDFAKAFNCPVGSFMNPEKKCRIW